MSFYTTHKFKRLSQAKVRQKQMKKMYGYKPAIFKVTGKGKTRYVVVKPRGLVRL